MSQRSTAFTLIEVLVSTAIGMALIAASWTAFSGTQRITKRAQARIMLHQSAKAVYETLRRDVNAWQPQVASWLRHDGTAIDVIFMTAVAEDEGWRTSQRYKGQAEYRPAEPDLVWCYWRYVPGAAGVPGRLLATRGTAVRLADIEANSGWTGIFHGWPDHPEQPGLQLDNTRYAIAAQPRRRTPSDDPLRLDDNRWGFFGSDNGAAQGFDIGDWNDLQRQLVPVHERVTACSFKLVCADGTVLDPATVTQAVRGLRMDGIESATLRGASADPLDRERIRRPSLLRCSFSLADVTGVEQSFSFSFSIPGPVISP